MSRKGHGKGLNYTGPVVTSAKIITHFATASSSLRYRTKRTDASWKAPHETLRAGRKTECTSQDRKRKRARRVREKGATRGGRSFPVLPSSTSPQDVVGTLLAVEK